MLGVHVAAPARMSGGPAPDIFAGVRFIWQRKPILAAVSLDLFAVLLGGAVALLPIYADKILHVGPIGLGWLRAAPAFGAITMAFLVAHLLPAGEAPGRRHALVGRGLRRRYHRALQPLARTSGCRWSRST